MREAKNFFTGITLQKHPESTRKGCLENDIRFASRYFSKQKKFKSSKEYQYKTKFRLELPQQRKY